MASGPLVDGAMGPLPLARARISPELEREGRRTPGPGWRRKPRQLGDPEGQRELQGESTARQRLRRWSGSKADPTQASPMGRAR